MWRSTRLSADVMTYCSIQAAVHPAADRVAGPPFRIALMTNHSWMTEQLPTHEE
jgi:hypothetical protein